MALLCVSFLTPTSSSAADEALDETADLAAEFAAAQGVSVADVDCQTSENGTRALCATSAGQPLKELASYSIERDLDNAAVDENGVARTIPTGCTRTKVVGTRFSACQIVEWTVIFRDKNERGMWLVTGGAAGSLRNTVWVRNGSTEIDFEGTVKVTSAWGTALGATMTLRSKCLLSCRNFMPVGHAKTLYDDVGITKSQTFNPNPSGKEPWITNPYWGLTIYKASYGGTEMIAFWFDVRCDYAAAPLSGKGCVIPDFLAELVIFTSAYPTYAAHVRKAQKTGLPSKLRRMYDETQKKANRDRACPASLPKKTGYSCDEYPFASTWQGAKTGGGLVRVPAGCFYEEIERSGSVGYSRCAIVGDENSAGGWDYQSFLQTNRVVADEWFTVKVI
ncbi:hypothetical protein [Cellulomonas sp. PSBB021]|uniref:NucA/NucB deoxyribonuclease domain-containing protein n=1 Tax=Cellulomonas sp. PSBB021 TaxID=2003551 RepID=UPI000B8D2E74|nr:hypothetical protein [Cellulomonas sp. PSBB021]ASR55627.1 hypothetical protein CBP52_11595 [Cellulomonas sp. PSBB021]